MRILAATVAVSGTFLVLSGAVATGQSRSAPDVQLAFPSPVSAVVPADRSLSPADPETVVEESCVRCHNERRLRGNLSLEDFQMTDLREDSEVGERMIRKLRAGMMPPVGAERPAEGELLELVTALETTIDDAAQDGPRVGRRVFQRLNRAEYERAVESLLDLDIDAGDWLPLDTKSSNFDNVADVQIPSATVLDAYVSAALAISRLAVGYPDVTETTTTYKVPRRSSQRARQPDAPRGTRGGAAVQHHFPVDGEYIFSMEFHATPTGELYGRTAPFDEEIEVSVDGERVALLPIDRWSTDADPGGLIYQTEPIPVTAGPHTVAAAFIRTFDGPVNDNVTPVEHSLVDTQIGQEYGVTNQTHLRDLLITGPFNVTGVSSTPSREKVFTCRPLSREEGPACARQILERLATDAYRGPLSEDQMADLMDFYRSGSEGGGFETGIRTALQAILASPHFIFRLEELPENAQAGGVYPLSDSDLASRLAFFLWGTSPDAELMATAAEGRLQDDDVLRAQALRMLEDPKAEALATRFAAQWLRLPDLEKIHPDALEFPDFDAQLAEAMQEETELFFHHLVAEDRSLFELYEADYSFMNERLARHYGIRGVAGEGFRKVSYPDDRRRGIFGHGSMLTLTSHANRTSPVLRGKWIMEVLMGTPPPPPPPNVPPLEDTEEATDDGRTITTAERLEMHRRNPSCSSCHSLIDPIGLALEHFDVTGAWRIREEGTPVDASGELYDGTPIAGAGDLRVALLSRPIPLIRTFTENLMAYALGRRVEAFDQPTVRAIAQRAAEEDHRMSAFILGVVESDAFRMQQATAATDSDDHQQ